MQGLLDSVPILLRNKNSVGPRPCDQHWLVGRSGFIQKSIEFLARFACIHAVHTKNVRFLVLIHNLIAILIARRKYERLTLIF